MVSLTKVLSGRRRGWFACAMVVVSARGTGPCDGPGLCGVPRTPLLRSKLDREGPGLTVEGYPGPDLLVMSATHRWGQPED